MGKMGMRLTLFAFVLSIILCYTVAGAENRTGRNTASQNEIGVTLVIYQVDGDTKLPVTGAEFVLSGEDNTYLSADPHNQNHQWVKEQEDATVLCPDSDGVISIDGVLPGTYYLTQTKAALGYHMWESPVKIHLSAQYDQQSTGGEISKLTVQVNDGKPVASTAPGQDRAEVVVNHTYGTVLPDTGGIGATFYYMLGTIVVFAVTLTVVAKRLVRQES